MSELKRKRDDDDDGADEANAPKSMAAGKTAVAGSQNPTASCASPCCSLQPSGGEEPQESTTIPATTPSPATPKTTEASSSTAPDTADGEASGRGPEVKSSGAGRSGPPTIVICGEEVRLKGTVGRRKRKHTLETLIILAYKGRLAMACKVNNMVRALEIYREMKSKGIKQDLSVS